MHRGFVKMWRKIDDHPIAVRPNYLSVLFWLVRHATHKPVGFLWNNKTASVKRGQLITSANKISAGTGVPRGTVERILIYLKSEEMIEEVTTKKFRLITVKNYQIYQSSEEVNEVKMRNKRGTSEEQVDTYKKVKKAKNVKKQFNYISFENQIEPLAGQYAPSLIEEFRLYWTETNVEGKEKWQLEDSWEIAKRLKRWQNNAEKWQHEKEAKAQLKQVDELPVERVPVLQEHRDSGFSGLGQIIKPLTQVVTEGL